VFMCFVWIWEQTAIISLYSIDWLVFITETECVYCAVRSTFYVLPTQCIYVFCVDLRTNSDYCTVQHWLVGFYNWDGVFTARYVLHSAHTLCLCVLCGSENKQRLFHCTTLTGGFYDRDGVCLLRDTFYVLPTQCIYVFCVDLRTNSDYFAVQHWLVVFLTETECVYCALQTELLQFSLFPFFISLHHPVSSSYPPPPPLCPERVGPST